MSAALSPSSSSLAAGLQRALAQLRRDGAARQPERRPLAAGPGPHADDGVRTLGPGDRPFEERHERACLAIVVAGSFGDRGARRTRR
ncbi:hypothetical protein [Paraburkholderia tropica]|uniref:Uncharacterized protein n=1 Tax=Paraburkholderia tropica TaxID=92647 RepID=A0AAQ1GKZ6_9BURK|nr:hypothetical protein [Paraburkholderia tropica]RQN40701.1 hypothetical protein EHZ25_00070 [Paraburkholderia tropica]SEK08970.1 hypothetical protein SAMN05216550_11769 [Paraburkholderia tropica]